MHVEYTDVSAATSSGKRPTGHRCNLCSRVFESADLLEAHKKMEHGESSHPPAGVG